MVSSLYGKMPYNTLKIKRKLNNREISSDFLSSIIAAKLESSQNGKMTAT